MHACMHACIPTYCNKTHSAPAKDASLDETSQHDPAGDYRASILQSPSSSEFLWCSNGVDDPESPDFRRAFSSASDIAFPDAHHGLDFEPFEQNSFEVRRK